MAQYVCDRCGAVNPVGTDFCISCHAFLAWDEIEEDPTTKPDEAFRSGEPSSSSEQNVETVVLPIRVPARPTEAETDDPSTSSHDGPTDSTEALFQAIAKQREVTVPATGEPAGLAVQVTNTSTIVDGYLVEASNAPDWLALESGQVRLLTGTDEVLQVKMRVVSVALVPAQQFKLVLRIRSISQAPAQLDLPVLVTVPVIDVPVRLHAEPSLLRVRDSDTAECTLVVDNSSSNRLVKLRISGSDPELAVRFRFEPQALEVGPVASASSQVAVAAPRPEPGEEISRQLTVTAFDGTRRVDTLITFVQSTSASPMTTLALRIEPSLVRVIDADTATVQVTIDNRRGRSGVRIFLDGGDPERAIRFTFSPRVMDLSPGQVGTAQLRLDSRRPQPGKESTRPFAVTASDGSAFVEASGSLVQTSSRGAIRKILIAGALVAGAVIVGALVLGVLIVNGPTQPPSSPEVRPTITQSPTVVVPDVVGLSAENAAMELADAGFKFSVEREHSGVVAFGKVIRTVPGPGEEVESGSKVTIYASIGP
jgi:hypothetical protein